MDILNDFAAKMSLYEVCKIMHKTMNNDKFPLSMKLANKISPPVNFCKLYNYVNVRYLLNHPV